MNARTTAATLAVAALLLTTSGCSDQDEDGCGDAAGPVTSVDAFIPADASAQLLAKSSKGGRSSSGSRGSKSSRTTVHHHSHGDGDGDDCAAPSPKPSWTFPPATPTR
ncbi:hypothetical protein [Kitasatospora terrestris]|uniref:Lipoprotein n=1 Tax=Kitasatospora terrestris TaxID=258051 RepID=A0ABP9DRU4_9ACTN